LIAWSTVALFVVDLGLGGRLQHSSVLGYSYFTAARFFGIGNGAFAVLAACGLIGASAVLDAGRPGRDRSLTAACLLALIVLIDGAPWLGADFGGLATLLSLVAGIAVVALWRRRVSWRRAVLVLAGAATVAAFAVGLDLLRPPDARTHVGRFVADIFSGDGAQSVATLARKATTNLRVLDSSVWTWLVPIAAVYAAILLTFAVRGRQLLPPRSARRVGFIATVAVGVVGFALNDSGVVVAAGVAVYVGPYLTLLALDATPARVPQHT
jgi:hypothetical protein